MQIYLSPIKSIRVLLQPCLPCPCAPHHHLATQSPVFQYPFSLWAPSLTHLPVTFLTWFHLFQNHILNTFSVLDSMLDIREKQMCLIFSQGRHNIMEGKRHINQNKTNRNKVLYTFSYHSKVPVLALHHPFIYWFLAFGNHRPHLKILYKLWSISLG